MIKISAFITALILSQSSFAISQAIKQRLKNFRDPFKRNIKILKKSKVKASKRTYFTNKKDQSNILIENLKITGVYLGENRRAIGQSLTDKSEPFVIKEGMLLGPDKVRVEAILPGGIVLVEKVTNVYDEVEYLETIIPISE